MRSRRAESPGQAALSMRQSRHALAWYVPFAPRSDRVHQAPDLHLDM